MPPTCTITVGGVNYTVYGVTILPDTSPDLVISDGLRVTSRKNTQYFTGGRPEVHRFRCR